VYFANGLNFMYIIVWCVCVCVKEGMVGRDNSVGIATHNGLDGHEIESRWGRDFPHACRPALMPTHPPIQWVPGLYRG